MYNRIRKVKRGIALYNRSVIKEKTREAMASVLPITAIVAVLCFALVPM